MPTPAKTTFTEALVAFQSEMPKVNKGKTATVPTKTGGSYKYTYADLADVTEQAVPVLTKHGFAFISKPRRCEDGTYELAGVLMHVSGDCTEGALPLIGRTAQEIGGSITYARRYLLGCMTGIVTDDDVDGADRSTQRTSQPTEIELAQGRVAEAWSAWAGKPFVLAEARDTYTQHTNKQLALAGIEELKEFAEYLDQDRQNQQAAKAQAAAERALGAQIMPGQDQDGEKAQQ